MTRMIRFGRVSCPGTRRRAVVAVAVLAACGVAGAVPSAALAGSSARPAGVTSYPAELLGVSAQSATDAWAVGESFPETVLHWNGTSWAKVPVPRPGTAANDLNAVSAVSASDAWAVGVSYDTHVGKTLTVHWNGSRWTLVPSPSYGGTSMYGSVLYGVAATSAADAWAVGYYSKPGPAAEFQTLILHWDGTRWTRVPSPEPPNSFLSGVTAVSASDAWAVGSYTTTSSAIGDLLLHWDGTRWTRVTVRLPQVTDKDDALSAVSADSPADAWAIGQYTTRQGKEETLALHWNGTRWTRVAVPTPLGESLLGVTALSPTRAWAVGQYYFPAKKAAPIGILHWNGTTWAQVPTPHPGGVGNILFGVAATSAADAWAVGSYQNENRTPHNLILHWNGTSWTRS
jgi:hypothetical protein